MDQGTDYTSFSEPQDEVKDLLLNENGREVAPAVYNAIIGGVLLWGLVLDVALAFLFEEQFLEINPILLLVIYGVLTIGGMVMTRHSSKPLVSFLGFTALSLGLGILLAGFITQFELGTVMNAFLIAIGVTLLMILISNRWPDFFIGLAKPLLIALGLAIVGELLCYAIIGSSMSWADAIVAVIFAGFIGFDWARAQSLPKTIDNAVDSAAELFIDIANLVLRIVLASLSDRDKD